MANYYNEIDPFAAEWLRNLIKQGLIPDGEVDTRSIADVASSDLREFTQCHFFAGIGGWSHALRLAQWPDDRRIWTGSCPCQPFSVAGKGKGKDDERHLWPVFHKLISQCRPPVVMGEQVAGKAGYDWFDGVATDLEGEEYSCRAIDIPACSVDAPHIRQRLYWCAVDNSDSSMCQTRGGDGLGIEPSRTSERSITHSSGLCDMVNSDSSGCGEHGRTIAVQTQQPGAQCAGGDASGAMDNAMRRRHGHEDEEILAGRNSTVDASGLHGDMAQPNSIRHDGACGNETVESRHGADYGLSIGSSSLLRGDMADANDAKRRQDTTGWGHCTRPNAGWEKGSGDDRACSPSFWHDAIWLTGADGKARRAQSGVRLLVDGVQGGVAVERALEGGKKEKHIYGRVGALRGFGNAIVPPLAAEVIKAFMDVEP